MDGKENQDPTSTATDVSVNSPTTTEQQQQQLSPTEHQQQPVRKSISPQEYIRQKQNERETPTPTEKKSWFFDLNEDEKPANPSSSLNTQSSLKVSTNHTDSSLDPFHILASTTTNKHNDEYTSISSSSSQNIKDTLQSSSDGSTIVQKQTPLQLLGQTTSKLGRQISKEDSTVKSELVSLNFI